MTHEDRAPGGPLGEEAPAGADPSADPFADVVVILMAGGFGTRFWPLSTPDRPKQFLTALTDRSLYQEAAGRARGLVPWDRILVMANARHLEWVRAQTPDLPPENIVCEPMRRDTAAAILLAALVVERRRPGSLMAVTPSDHLVTDREAFRETMTSAVARARQGGLGTIGVPPTCPATGFGYLELAEAPSPPEPQPVRRFVEKPDRERAEQYLASGRHLWNAGMFIWRVRGLLEAAARHLPETLRALEPLAGRVGEADFCEKARRAFEGLEAISIDYGIMERADGVWTVPATFGWNDVGGWTAAEALIPADEGGNRVRGRVQLHDASGVLAVGREERPLLIVGLSDCIIVESERGTLVCHKSAAEAIKPLVNRILGGT